MTDTQKSTSKKMKVQGKKAEALTKQETSNETEMSLAEYQLSILQGRGLCAELPTDTANVLGKALASDYGLDTVGTYRIFIVVDTREE
jgi:hypothetical protein